jgi:2-haloacid dehalogenase
MLLDFYGTVVRDDDDEFAAVCARVAAATGVPQDEVADAWLLDYCALADDAQGPAFRRLRDLAHDSLGRTVATLAPSHRALDLDELVAPMFASWDVPEPYPDALAFLADPPVPVCLVSDADEDVLAASLELLGLDLPAVTSERSRAYKPAAPSFDLALEVLGLGPDDVVHVGDSLTSDVAGAHARGIRSVWVNRTGRELPPSGPPPTWTVPDLEGLASLVRGDLAAPAGARASG